MAPRDLTFFRNFNCNNHDVLVQKKICHTFNYSNNSITLLKTRLKSVREKFAAVNNYYLKDIYYEAAGFSSLSGIGCEKNENTWFAELRSVTYLRLELLRKTMVTYRMKERMEDWQKRRDEISQNRKSDILCNPKFQREDILIKKENYKLILEQIQQRTNTEQTFEFNHQQRSREICFKASLAKAVLIVSIINNYFNNELLVLNIGKQMDVFYSMKSRLDVLKNIKIVEEAPLVNLQNLVKDLTLYKNNVIEPIQAEIEAGKIKIKNKKNLMNSFAVNIPEDNALVITRFKRQYRVLAKNNKELLNNLNIIENLPFKNDSTKKILRQDIIKIITTLINTISSINFTDKYNKLNALLSGKLVCVANTKVIIGDNKEALVFCLETLVTKIINYAEEVISVTVQAAYEVAEVIVKLWSVHQQFGNILFAEIKKRCPLLVPFCNPVAKSLTNKVFDKKSFGYKFDLLGNVESHNKYLKRMTGIIRFYAALIVTSSKHEKPVIGLGQAWIFLASTLNQHPVADITATMLVEFLNITGFTMHLAYGKQFLKLLQYINIHYLKEIILVTPSGHGGPITRLNSFISKHQCIGSFEEPKSMLSSNCW